MDDPLDEDALDDAPLLGPQTAEQHRAAAIALLRKLVDSPGTKPQDRRAAAADLLKVLAEEQSDPVAERKAQQLTDEELLLVIADAQARRAAAKGGAPLESVPLAPPVSANPRAPAGEGSRGFTWNEGGPDDATVAAPSFEALLADVPDLPHVPSIEELCS
jgi:hypothetical protein